MGHPGKRHWQRTITALTVDAAGSLYVGGAFSGSASTYGASMLQAAGQTDAVVGKLSATGQWLWARRAGDNAPDNVTTLAYDPTTGALHAGGATVSRQLAFGPVTLTVPSEVYKSAFLGTLGGQPAPHLAFLWPTKVPIRPVQAPPSGCVAPSSGARAAREPSLFLPVEQRWCTKHPSRTRCCTTICVPPIAC